VSASPQTALPVGVHAWVVSGAPQLVGTSVGVQLVVAAGRGAVQATSSTVWPSSSTQVSARVATPEPPIHAQLALRDCVPLSAVGEHAALRDCEPEPEHTAAAEHAPHAP
jgi:hypothetical protein